MSSFHFTIEILSSLQQECILLCQYTSQRLAHPVTSDAPMGFHTRPIQGRFLDGLSIDKHSILEYSRSRIHLYNFISHNQHFTI